MKTDLEIIEYLGGATELAKLLGLDKKRGGIQRVHNWKKRGIPPAIKLKYPTIFLKHLSLQ
jgi:hypothetical protein